MSEGKPDTVPGLGFKDKEKALETIKNLDGRDPDYQSLAIKGLIRRANRTLTVTKDKEKLQHIKDAIGIFEDWLRKFEINGLSKENRAYLPLAAIEALLPLKEKYKLDDKQTNAFLEAYKNKAKGDYKNLRTVTSGEDEPSWDIVRNKQLKKLLKGLEDEAPQMWKDDLPTKEHLELILWAYSPDASKIKKNISVYVEKLGTSNQSDEDEEMEEDEEEETIDKKKKSDDKKAKKRKSSGESSSSDESPKKKNKGD